MVYCQRGGLDHYVDRLCRDGIIYGFLSAWRFTAFCGRHYVAGDSGRIFQSAVCPHHDIDFGLCHPGYWFGRKIGPAMFSWKDRWYFKQKYLQQARVFYEDHGAGAIFLARFIPFVRTFAPIVAGIVQMDKKKFSAISIISAFVWVFSMMLLGRYLHQFLLNKFGYDLTHDLEWIVLGIIFISVLPILFKMIQARIRGNKEAPVE
jgi:hypothetical protein